MTKQIKILTGLVTLLAALAATAQSSNAVRVDVPFPFVTAGKMWPAANYTVQVRTDNGVVTLTLPGIATAMVLTNPYPRPGEVGSHLQFRRSGDRWLLEEVMVNGTAHLLPTGESEKELANEHVTVGASLPIEQ